MGIRVFIVDDHALVRAGFRLILGGEGDIEVVGEADSAEAALPQIRKLRPDVVLCDLLMPDMSGMDLHEALAQTRPGLEERLVFMTGGAFTARARDFLRRVGNPRLEKPFEFEQLHAIVGERLAQNC